MTFTCVTCSQGVARCDATTFHPTRIEGYGCRHPLACLPESNVWAQPSCLSSRILNIVWPRIRWTPAALQICCGNAGAFCGWQAMNSVMLVILNCSFFSLLICFHSSLVQYKRGKLFISRNKRSYSFNFRSPL